MTLSPTRSPPTLPAMALPADIKDLLDCVGGCAGNDPNRGRVLGHWGQFGFLHWLDMGDMEHWVDPHECWKPQTDDGRVYHPIDLERTDKPWVLRGQPDSLSWAIS